MRRIFVILLIVLLVLTSCSTGKVKQEEPEVEVVAATPEKVPTSEVPATEPSPATEEVLETEVPESGEPESAEPEAVIEVLADDEVIVVDEPEPIDEETAQEIIQALADQDWGKVITATAPEAEKPAVEKVEEAVKQVAEALKGSETASASTGTQTAPAAQESKAEASKKASAEKSGIAAFFRNIGNFVMKEKLLSIGLLVCCVGVVYLIAALFISRHPKRPRRRHEDEEYTQDNDAESGEDEDGDDEAYGQDDVPQGDDDAFLRSLLGEDKK